ncbi:MAG: right-handed parallel beta-helix repeat-containing protein [Deltaproteobacteria bacterium]|nr:right-handed parallel beta-helix repeat-containing protein [Deltaproteobacteria bacterium]
MRRAAVPGVLSRTGVVLALLAGVGGGAARAGTFYVGKSGCSDDGPGSSAQPFCALGKAAGKLKPGDTLLVKAGTWGERLVVPVSGAAGQVITIQAETSGAAILDGSSLGFNDQGLLALTGRSYVTIRGLTLRRSPYFAAQVSKSNNIVLDKLLVDTSEHGGIIVDQGSVGVTVSGCEVRNANACGADCAAHEAVSISNASEFIVAGNFVHDGAEEGIDLKDGSKNGQVYGNTVSGMGAVGIYLNHVTGARVYGNRVRANKASGFQISVGDSATGTSRTENNAIYQNVVDANTYNGVEFWSAGSGTMGDNRIYNNVFYQNAHYGVQLSNNTSKVTGTIVRNNIFVGNKQGGIDGSAASTSTISNNLFGGGNGPTGGAPVSGDPGFVNVGQGDFKLLAGSPAIDRGFEMGLPKVGAPDIGAFEFGLSSTVPGADAGVLPPPAGDGGPGPGPGPGPTHDGGGVPAGDGGGARGDSGAASSGLSRNQLLGGCAVAPVLGSLLVPLALLLLLVALRWPRGRRRAAARR